MTDDYGYLNLSVPFRCINEGTKRKVVYPNDLIKYHKVWDKKINTVIFKINTIDQPLRPFINLQTWHKIEQIIAGKEQMESILKNNFEG